MTVNKEILVTQPLKGPLHGLVAATFTPMDSQGELLLDRVPAMVDALVAGGVQGLYVAGSTGEGPLLTSDERKRVAQAYINAAAGRVPVAVQVGHASLAEAMDLAAHAQQVGADAISAIPPTYFKPSSTEALCEAMGLIMNAAPKVPFYYYHIPSKTGVTVNVADFLAQSAERSPSLVGVKFTDTRVFEFQECVERFRGRFQMLWGFDEMLLSGLTVGADGAVGSTYNFAPALYRTLMAAVEQGDLIRARALQYQSIRIIRPLLDIDGVMPALKAMMQLVGFDCGPTRPPLVAMTASQIDRLREQQTEAGFFDWALAPSAVAAATTT